jgi:DNA (cytosine-5)-methyltransferase 1
MHLAGFHVAAALEFDPHAATTYMINLARPGVQLHFDSEERRKRFERYMTKHLGINAPSKTSQAGVGALGDARRGSRRVLRPGSIAGSGWIGEQPPSEPGCEHFWLADARNVAGLEIVDTLGLEVGEVDVVFGGPPCQGFSMAGKREVMDPRNSLVFEFARLVLEMQPKAMVLENVPGMVSMVTPEGVPVIDALARVLADGGWSTMDAIRRSLLASSAGRARRCARPTGRRGRRGSLAWTGTPYRRRLIWASELAELAVGSLRWCAPVSGSVRQSLLPACLQLPRGSRAPVWVPLDGCEERRQQVIAHLRLLHRGHVPSAGDDLQSAARNTVDQEVCGVLEVRDVEFADQDKGWHIDLAQTGHSVGGRRNVGFPTQPMSQAVVIGHLTKRRRGGWTAHGSGDERGLQPRGSSGTATALGVGNPHAVEHRGEIGRRLKTLDVRVAQYKRPDPVGMSESEVDTHSPSS